MAKCFEVQDIFPYQEGVALLGRCINGPIRRGDVFATLFRTQAFYAEDRTVELSREEIGKINLIVHDIQYFNRSVEELQAPHSGGLYVTGDGVGLLIQGAHIET